MTKKRHRCVHLNVMVTPEEQELIEEKPLDKVREHPPKRRSREREER